MAGPKDDIESKGDAGTDVGMGNIDGLLNRREPSQKNVSSLNKPVQVKSHSHCMVCVTPYRCSSMVSHHAWCEVKACEFQCEAIFHACKSDEHFLLCPNVKVPCINAVYGCNAFLLRRDCGPHLATCPASVVCCTMEWNRWPLCSLERQPMIPFQQQKPNAREGQLDVALAMRDQRMLNQWLYVPRKQRRVLCNSLTKRFPAVPVQTRIKTLHSSGDSLTNSVVVQLDTSFEEDSPWEAKRAPPGLQSSVCIELAKARRRKVHHSDTLGLQVFKSPQHNHDCQQCGIPIQSCDNHLTRDGDQGKLKKKEMLELKTDQILNGFVEHKLCSSPADKLITIPPPPSIPPLLSILGLDLMLESITRYQAKPRSMYTFICAQDFRRDEFSWHYKNVHSDIHGGLNGWMEQRCPLAMYGCMYSQRRFYPTSEGSSVVHSNMLESFGVRRAEAKDMTNCCAFNKQNSLKQKRYKLLPDLPFEILCYVTQFLDSFSLNNLSLTSWQFREVCETVLQKRGIVVQQWCRRPNTKPMWEISRKVWHFSTAFSPVDKWGFENSPHMANHMKECMYYSKVVKTKPYFFPMEKGLDSELFEKLKQHSEDKATVPLQ